MTREQFLAIKNFRMSFKKKVAEWGAYNKELIPLQKESSKNDTPSYPLETPIVYNTSLDSITEEDDIKLIVIGDNPGKDEQRAKNQKYLVGQSGKLAENFFKKNDTLGIDFRKNTIILNKTPVHTAKTKHLRTLQKSSINSANNSANINIANIIEQSQIWMARETARLHQALCKNTEPNDFVPELWLVGYAELKKGGLFTLYKETLKNEYFKSEAGDLWEKVFVYQHFSMNRFFIDLNNAKKNISNELSLKDVLQSLGKSHRIEIFSE